MAGKAKVLTQTRLDGLRAASPGTRYQVADALVPGFAVRVTDRGVRTYILIARYPGSANPTRRALGQVGALTLAQARQKARDWLAMIKRGVDPANVEAAARDAEEQRRALTFGAVMEDYIVRVVRKRRHGVRDEREIRKELMPRWAGRPLADITRRDVVLLIDSITERGALRQAHNVFGHIRGFFRWCTERGAYGIEASPTDHLRPASLIGPKATRDRVLDGDEIGAFWRACDGLGYPFGPLHKLLLLTGQRKNEIGQARWSEVDLESKVLVIPASRYKTGVEHVVPLSDDAMMILRDLPRFLASDFVFTFDGRRPVAPYTHDAKRAIDQSMSGELGTVTPFVVHDLRRTVRSRLSELRVNSDVAEAVLGHQRRGVVGVYDRYTYATEKRQALEAWAHKLRSIVDPPPANVVTLR